MVGEVLQTDEHYHIMCTTILSTQNMVFFSKNYKRDIGAKIRTFYEFRLDLETVPDSFFWQA